MPLLRFTARRVVFRHGPNALAWLYQREVAATGGGDRLSADAWAEIAKLAEEILSAGDVISPD